MISRAIHIFPKFENMNLLNSIRKKYDPLFNFIKPHITIIFPFDSNLSTEDIEKILISNLLEFNQFEIQMDRISGHFDGYIYLNISKGIEQIIKIYNKLYSNQLSKYYDNRYTYIPHIILGRISNRNKYLDFLQNHIKKKYCFKSTVKKISVEIINDDETSEIEYEYNLSN